MIIIGIDPGITGAVAIVGRNAILFETPTIAVKGSNKKWKTLYDERGMASIIRTYSESFKGSCHVIIEKVSAMPGQGVTSMFNFGMGYGIWRGIIAAYEIPFTLVTPQAWKKEMMAGFAEKDDARIIAMRLFPKCNLNKKKDIGKADALLIAEYGRRNIK